MHNERYAEYAVHSVVWKHGTDEPRKDDGAKQLYTYIYMCMRIWQERAAAFDSTSYMARQCSDQVPS